MFHDDYLKGSFKTKFRATESLPEMSWTMVVLQQSQTNNRGPINLLVVPNQFLTGRRSPNLAKER